MKAYLLSKTRCCMCTGYLYRLHRDVKIRATERRRTRGVCLQRSEHVVLVAAASFLCHKARIYHDRPGKEAKHCCEDIVRPHIDNLFSNSLQNKSESERRTKVCKTASKNPRLLYNSSRHSHPFRAATAQTHQWLISNRTLCAFANEKAEGPYFHISTASLDQSFQRIWHRRG